MSDSDEDVVDYHQYRRLLRAQRELKIVQPVSHKRTGYLDWDEYFMATAFLAAKRSKDPVTQVGACIVDQNRIIVGVGYNGMPTGCSDDEFPWSKDSTNKLEAKYLYVCHAEMNAILNKNCATLRGCHMYVALFPCNECAKFIIQSGIKEVVYMSDKYAAKKTTMASKKMLNAAKVTLRQFIPREKKITIDFTAVDWSTLSQVPATPKKHPPAASTQGQASNHTT